MTLLPKEKRMDSNAFSEKEFDTLMFSYFEGSSDAAKLQKLVCYLREPLYIRRFVDLFRQDLIMYHLASKGVTGKSYESWSRGYESQGTLNLTDSVIVQLK